MISKSKTHNEKSQQASNVCCQEASDKPEEPQKFNNRQLSSRGKKILFMIGLGQLCIAMGVSLNGPFFSSEAKRKGVSTTFIGMISGSF